MIGSPCKALLLLGSVVAAVMASPRFDPSWSRLAAGTEIPELRSSTSRTYSNGDGTFTADIAPMRTGGADSQDSCQPTSTGGASRFYEPHGGRGYYDRGGPDMRYRFGNAFVAAYAKFDLSTIPDSSLVLSAQLRCYQYEVGSTPVRTRCNYLDLDPDSESDSAVFWAVFNGLVLADTQSDGIGWVGYDLSPQGLTILEGRLQQNWATLGIKPVTSQGVAYGIRGDDKQTYLHIVYNAAGTCEPQGTSQPLPELVLTPSPATGRFVTVQCDVAAGTRRKLAIRNLLGRAVRSFVLNPSGIAQLDLRGLPSGVYIATLEAGPQSLTRKLVITAR